MDCDPLATSHEAPLNVEQCGYGAHLLGSPFHHHGVAACSLGGIDSSDCGAFMHVSAHSVAIEVNLVVVKVELQKIAVDGTI